MKLARIKDPESEKIIRGTVKADSVETESGRFGLSKVELLTPVTPSKIICVGLNYKDHISETGAEAPEDPSFFFKPPSATVAPGNPIKITEDKRYDPEGEVAVVIEKKCRNVKIADALDYIWGYTGLNDVTNRDAQDWEQNWVRAKGFDTAAPLGPFLVTPHEVELPISFELEVNGSTRQSSDTSNLIFGLPELISELSSFMTLERGDVISTGTPRGVAPIERGDKVKLKLNGIGNLENPVQY